MAALGPVLPSRKISNQAVARGDCARNSAFVPRKRANASLRTADARTDAAAAAKAAADPDLAAVRTAALRFIATRAYDWLNTPADALVTRKDPMAFARRLEFYADPANAGIFST